LQVEGGFIMAISYLLTEEVLFGTVADPATRAARGAADQIQVNLGTWNYKPMSAFDIPQVLNVSLLPGVPNPSPAAVMSSKACGEPPMALAAAVALAVKAAIAAARRDLHGLTDYLALDLPLTVEKIQQACAADDALSLN
jgi:xanthine dehydrogenase/oxidase